MKSFEEEYLGKIKFSADILLKLRALGEYKGKEELFTKQSPDILEKLLESAIIESTEASNKIEGITAPHERIEMIVKANAAPRNRPEEEIAGYRDVLNLIHQSHEDIPLSENVILQFHSMLYRYTTKKSGFWKKSDNEIVDKKPDGTKVVRFKPISAMDAPLYMGKLISYIIVILKKKPLILLYLYLYLFLIFYASIHLMMGMAG